MKKKILFLITKATWGGAQRYAYDLATHLPKDYFAVSVAYGTPGRLLEMLKEANIKTHPLPALGRDIALWSDVKSFVQLVQLFRKERPDIVHLNSSKAAALGALAARMVGIPRVVFTVHGWPFKEDRNAIARLLIRCISWLTTLLSYATIVVSKKDEEIGKNMLLVGKKIYHIPLGIEAPAFLTREEASAALSISSANSRLVTIGELTKNKGHRYAIDAVAKLKKRGIKVEYFLIGDGELRAQLEEQVRQSEVSDRVHFLGFVEDAPRYLKAFDVFLLPSIKEGMPYVLLEAAAAGLPIVATNVIDLSFTDQTPHIVLVPPANTTLLADALERSTEIPLKGSLTTRQNFSQMIQETTLYY